MLSLHPPWVLNHARTAETMGNLTQVLTVFPAMSPDQALANVFYQLKQPEVSLGLQLHNPVVKTIFAWGISLSVEALGTCASYNLTKPCAAFLCREVCKWLQILLSDLSHSLFLSKAASALVLRVPSQQVQILLLAEILKWPNCWDLQCMFHT